jgi:hypothetical protein
MDKKDEKDLKIQKLQNLTNMMAGVGILMLIVFTTLAISYWPSFCNDDNFHEWGQWETIESGSNFYMGNRKGFYKILERSCTNCGDLEQKKQEY